MLGICNLEGFMKIAFDIRAIPQSGIGVYTRILKESLPLYFDNINVCYVYSRLKKKW